MLRALKATDVASIHEINKDALGYDFSPEETASQLTKLSQDSHHSYWGLRNRPAMTYLGMYMLRFMNPFILMPVLIFWL